MKQEHVSCNVFIQINRCLAKKHKRENSQKARIQNQTERKRWNTCAREKKQTHLNIRTYENGFTLFSGNEPMHSTQSRNMVSLKMTFSIFHHGQARSCSGLAACKRPTSGGREIIPARTNPTSRICTSQRRRRASTPSADTVHGRPSFTPGSPKGACLHGGSERQAA